MRVSYRSMLTSGVVALTATAVVAAPAITPVAQPAAERAAVTVPVQNTAAVTPFVSPLPSPLGSESAIKAPALRSIAPAEPQPAAGIPSDRAVSPFASSTIPPTNVVSEAVDWAYEWVIWAADVGVNAVTWAMDWIFPLYLIGDQVELWYGAFRTPFLETDLANALVSVLNDPLSLGAWGYGLNAIGNGLVTSVGNGIRDEVDYILDFGWLPFYVPPLPRPPILQRQAALEAPTEAASELTSPLERTDLKLREVSGLPSVVALGEQAEMLTSRITHISEQVETLAESVTEKLDPTKLLTGEKSLFKLPGEKSALSGSDAKLKLPSLRDLQTQATEKLETVKDRAGARFQKVTDAADSVAKRLTKPFTSSANDAGKSDGAKSGYTPRTKIGQKVQQAAKSLASKVSKKDGPSD